MIYITSMGHDDIHNPRGHDDIHMTCIVLTRIPVWVSCNSHTRECTSWPRRAIALTSTISVRPSYRPNGQWRFPMDPHPMADHRQDREGIDRYSSIWVVDQSLYSPIPDWKDKWRNGEKEKGNRLKVSKNEGLWGYFQLFAQFLPLDGLTINEGDCRLAKCQCCSLRENWKERSRRGAVLITITEQDQHIRMDSNQFLFK